MKILSLMSAVALIALSSGAFAQQSNAVFIDQIGDESRVTINQEGSRNRVGESATGRAVLGGARGSAGITQRGSDNTVSRFVTVEGTRNVKNVTQQGDRNAYVYGRTVGSENNVSLNQNGSANRATTWINGDRNALAMNQEGRDNVATLSAAGSDNRLSSWAKGERNTATVNAAGSRNNLSVSQNGYGHSVNVNHTGSGASMSISQK
ncbi:MAG: hypothetical protein ACRC7G_08915 [Beijerinckiaceae bacterium]